MVKIRTISSHIFPMKDMSTSKLLDMMLVAFILYDVVVCRVDGLKPGPFDLGTFDASLPFGWHSVAQPAIETRMQQFGAAETHFALLRICQKRSSVLESVIASLNSQLEASMQIENDSERQNITAQLAKYNALLDEERQKEAGHAAENVRRRHNYIPFIVEMLHSLSKAGKLTAMIDRAVNNPPNNSSAAQESD
jgi:ubiquitin carboxyl-terminal hydrolase L5